MTKTKHQHIPLSPLAKKSSQIHSTGFDPASGTLSIQFHGKDGKPGSIYHYQNFTQAKYDAFLKAESIGSHFGKTIKGNTKDHPFVRVN